MISKAPFTAIRRLPLFRGLASKLGSLLLLFQRSPLVQMLLPEARLLGGSGLGEAAKWSIKAVVGLGAIDAVAGATEIAQVAPQQGEGEVTAWTGGFLNFVVQVVGTPSVDQVSWTVDGLPPGLTNSDTATPSIHSISGTPTEVGETTVTLTAWEGPNQTGSSFSQEFLIIVQPGIITTHPASVALASGGGTTLSVVADPNGGATSYRWFQGPSGFGSEITGSAGNKATLSLSNLTTTRSYWVRVTQGDLVQNSNTAVVTVTGNIIPPVITTQPLSRSIESGGTATLTVAASGTSPAFRWYLGDSGDTSTPVGDDNSSTFTTPSLTAITRYWVQASNSAGVSNSNTAVISVNPPAPVGAGPFKVGEAVTIDLSPLTSNGETLKLVGKLPKGLKLNLATKQIAGTVTGLAGIYPVRFNVLQGKTVVRVVEFPIEIAGSLYFSGKYEALLEDEESISAGAFRLLFKKGNTWSATLQSPGSKLRKASGKIMLLPGTTAGTLSAVFAASSSAPAVTIHAALDLESPVFSGSYNGGTLRGFRLAEGEELPVTSKTINLVFEAGVHDGFNLPAGIGWLSGSIGAPSSATFSGLLGDGTAVKFPIQLSSTGQALVWSQPYKNLDSYLGGIITLPDLGQESSSVPPLAENLWWFKGPDAKSLSYPAGFPALEVSAGSSVWAAPATAAALGASLGWLENSGPAVEIDGAGLSNASPQLLVPTLPSQFVLDSSFNLSAPAAPAFVPWTGKVNPGNGTFTGILALPADFVPDGVAGAAAATGVLLQSEVWGSVTGCGLIKVPIAGSKGSFRTAAIILNQ
jgi:hypothetical protein